MTAAFSLFKKTGIKAGFFTRVRGGLSPVCVASAVIFLAGKSQIQVSLMAAEKLFSTMAKRKLLLFTALIQKQNSETLQAGYRALSDVLLWGFPQTVMRKGTHHRQLPAPQAMPGSDCFLPEKQPVSQAKPHRLLSTTTGCCTAFQTIQFIGRVAIS